MLSFQKRVTLSPKKSVSSPSSSSEEDDDIEDPGDFEDPNTSCHNCDPKNCGIEDSILVVTSDIDSESDSDKKIVKKETKVSDDDNDDDDDDSYDISNDSDSESEPEDGESETDASHMQTGFNYVENITKFPFPIPKDSEKVINEQIIEGPRSLLATLGLLKKLKSYGPDHATLDILKIVFVPGPQWYSSPEIKRPRELIHALGALLRDFNIGTLILYFHPISLKYPKEVTAREFGISLFSGYLKYRGEGSISEIKLKIDYDFYLCGLFFQRLIRRTQIESVIIKYHDFPVDERPPGSIADFLPAKKHATIFQSLKSLKFVNGRFDKHSCASLSHILITCPIETLWLDRCFPEHVSDKEKPSIRKYDWHGLLSTGLLAARSLKHLRLVNIYDYMINHISIRSHAFIKELTVLFRTNNHIETLSLEGIGIYVSSEEWMALFNALKRSRYLREPVDIKNARSVVPDCFTTEASQYMRK
jgi:hypothetical protein